MPPPKLVAPMTGKVQKMTPSDTRDGAARDSLMVAWDRLAEAVDDAGLRHPTRQPARDRRLQLGVERVRALARLAVHVLVALELTLERELANQRRTDDPGPPERHVGLRREAVSEVEHADVL